MKNICKLTLNKFLILFWIIIIPSLAISQQEKGKFLFPIKPGMTNYLSANMGELRPNHFHGGYDVKTDAKTGYPVYASEAGYVSRIKVSTFGYGNVVYITHPGNLKTVYAHLDKFNTPIGDYVLKKQYDAQSFAVELELKPGEIPIKRGEIIGLAGNTGSSMGPHLHYEIRDTNDIVLNPSDFGFEEVKDNIQPFFQKLAIIPMDINSRINGEFSRQEFATTKAKGSTIYNVPGKIIANGILGLELKAMDKKNNTHNAFGINFIQVSLDGQVIFTHNLMSFSFDETRFINAHLDYPIMINQGRRFERLFVSDGNKLSSYSFSSPLKGRIVINDDKIHKVKITIADDFHNESVLQFNIQGKPLIDPPIPASTILNQALTTSIQENTLKISTKANGDPGCTLYLKNGASKITPAYVNGGQIVYLYDLRKGLPDSLRVGALSSAFNFVKMIPSGSEQKVATQNVNVTFPTGALSDTLYLQMKNELTNGRTVYSVQDITAPLQDSMILSITPKEMIFNKSRTNVYYLKGSKPSFEGGEWKGNKIEVKTRNLGKFTLLEDSIKPSIALISNFGNSLKFRIKDDLSGIKNFKATLNGYWVLMNYDHKSSLIWSERLDKTVPLKGDFKLEVFDNAGNSSVYTLNLE